VGRRALNGKKPAGGVAMGWGWGDGLFDLFIMVTLGGHMGAHRGPQPARGGLRILGNFKKRQSKSFEPQRTPGFRERNQLMRGVVGM